jgi:prepilin-type N-terminal cleavage/methylation domain-containing protein
MTFTLKKRAGFTLVELLVVMAIASILLGVTVPKISALFADPVEKTVTRLRGAMMRARWLAARDNRTVFLVFDIRGQKVLTLRRKGAEWKRLDEMTLPSGVHMAGLWRASGISEKKEALRFFPDGGGEGFGLFLKIGSRRLTAIGYPFRQGIELVPGWVQEKEIG